MKANYQKKTRSSPMATYMEITFLSSKKHLECSRYMLLLTGNLLAIAHGVRKNKIILIILLIVPGVELLYDLTGLFHRENLDLLLPSKDIKTYWTIIHEIQDLLSVIRTHGETLFQNSPNDHNDWYRRPFSKCEPFCSWYRSDDALGQKSSREVTYNVTEIYPVQREAD